eukprot:TRINITY_DN15437_c0_g5_i2.p1 TRINITY_DN15437_c0_g5~~TRINITY_DN15437_c0_g5_i2.p1  ORF type:complete len:272 (+),score=43.38 TRINITY_DN15437_c0_g5_i2:175-990(+)
MNCKAGYLVHHDGSMVASALYCELHPQCDEGTAKLVLYEDETCQVLLTEILLTEHSNCSEKVGINCSCFSLEDHQFSSRSLAERRLWLRAISNLKVKLQNRAPSPTEEELHHYRLAIQEHVKAEAGEAQSQAPMDPLLQRLQDKRSAPNGIDAGIAADRCETQLPLPGPSSSPQAAGASPRPPGPPVGDNAREPTNASAEDRSSCGSTASTEARKMSADAKREPTGETRGSAPEAEPLDPEVSSESSLPASEAAPAADGVRPSAAKPLVQM